jgi:phage/plasmid-like protein (TIGR03299 family)
MAHQLSIRKNGFVEMAFTGSRDAVWHKLGQQLEVGAPIEQWVENAGMDWNVEKSPVQYTDNNGVQHNFPGQFVLTRSDTSEPLSIKTDSYKIVQPREVLEFFRDLVNLHDMQLSTAGVLFGGRKFWALAETGKNFKLNGVDEVVGHLLLTTSVDGTSPTVGRFVSTRVVCNNTLQVALGEKNNANMVKVSHKVEFDPKAVKVEMGLMDQAWYQFRENVEKLTNTPMSSFDVDRFFKRLAFDPAKDDDKQGWGAEKTLANLKSLYTNGAGAEMAKGTAWGALNAVTNLFTHGTGRKSESSQFESSYYGKDSDMKQQAFDLLLAQAA